MDQCRQHLSSQCRFPLRWACRNGRESRLQTLFSPAQCLTASIFTLSMSGREAEGRGFDEEVPTDAKLAVRK
jgi:hypothetical protein